MNHCLDDFYVIQNNISCATFLRLFLCFVLNSTSNQQNRAKNSQFFFLAQMAFLLRKPRLLRSSLPTSFVKTLNYSTTADEVSSDAISEFTDDLTMKSRLRWEIRQQKQMNYFSYRNPSRLQEATKFIDAIKRASETSVSEVMFLSVDFEKLDEKHIDHLVLSACLDENIEFLEKFVDQCDDFNRVIGEKTMIILCEYFSTLSNSRMLIKITDSCKRNNRLVYDQNCEFKPFLVRNLWEKGNLDGALTLLYEAYEQANTTVRNSSIRWIYQFIVDDTVDNKSEAVLVRLIRAATLLKERLNEPSVLLYIWKICFQSNWYSNQVIAEQLFSEHLEIRNNAAKRRGLLSYNALSTGEVDVVLRLIQTFLKFEMKAECKLILELLFEYHYTCKNLRACSEVLKSSLELDINLGDTYNQMLLNLLMGSSCNVIKPKKRTIPQFDFKF